MDSYELAGMLFGAARSEGAESTPDNRDMTVYGIAKQSEDGRVLVHFTDDVTLPEDDGLEHDNYIELPSEVYVEDGDEVAITMSGGVMSAVRVSGVIGGGDRMNVRIAEIEADYVKASRLEADVADIGFLKADSAVITSIQADTAKVHNLTADQLSAATAYIASLNAGNVTAESLIADVGKVHTLTADELSAAAAYIAALDASSVTAQRIAAISGSFDTVQANAAKVANLTAQELEADHATIGSLDANYAQVSLANVNNAWIASGVIRDAAISDGMINSVSANKLTAGTIDASNITVTNLNADNITTGTINGQRIGEGSLSLDKLSEDVYTEAEVDTIVDGLNDRIDGAIETHTGTAVPTLNNQPASSWNTTKLRDEHVGDVYYVVNSQSQQNGYCYRFTKSGNTYSWQLIKDSDVTAALSRLTTAEGKITTFDSDISKLKTDTGTLTTKTESLETRMTDAEADILDKVDTTTFNEVSDTVDQHSQTISQHTTAISNKADSSTVTAVTNRVSKNEQDISGINTTIGELQETVESKADGSTVSTISNKLNTVSDTVDGHTQTLTSVQNTLSGKADSSTVSTLTTKVNNVSDTVDGHTSQLSSITTTQTTMQTTLDKTVKSSIQLWYSKANTTAPSKPTSQVTSTSTAGNAWRIVVPAYNASYPNYYYCWQYEYVDGTYGWSAVVRDIAMGESQSTARTAYSNASAAVTTANTASTNASTALSTANTANTNASDAKTTAATANTTASEAKTTAETAASDASTAKTNAASAVTTANSASTTATNAQNTANANIKSSVQLWFTKANSTAPNKPTSVVSTSNANTANAWNLVVPVWNSSYPHYFYCYQQQKGDGNYQWTDVVYDRATSEAQQLANTTSTSLTTLQEDYATYKQTTTANVSSIGSRLTTAEGKISTAETAIGQNSDAIALRATKTEVQQVRPAYASSSTAAGTAAKVATIDPAVTGYALYKGASVAVTFSTANTAATPTLNLNSTGAKQIRSYTGAALSEAEYKWAAGATIDLVYDGTYWRMQDGGAVKRVTAAEASISVNAENIESKVSKNGVISSINQSAETVKIQASKVEIDGTAVFNAISSDVDDAITSKGYQTSSQVNSAITSKGYATTTQAQGYASTAKSEAISAAATDATTKANAAQTAATNAANTATDNKLKSYSTTAQANSLYDAKGAAATAENNAKAYTDALEIGGRNLLLATPTSYKQTSYDAYIIPSSTSAKELGAGTTLTIQFWGVTLDANSSGIGGYWGGGSSGQLFSIKPDENGYCSKTFAIPASTASHAQGANKFLSLYNLVNGHSGTSLSIGSWKLERGNKVTDWTPAPEDVAADIAAAQATANAAAPKASAVKRTQRIWYRTNASSAPSTPGTASSNWVTKADDGNDAWTKMHIAISSTHKYIYTCEQYEMANGTVGYTSVLLDNTITVIDGGNIITGTVTANKLNAADINASKSLTVGAMTDAAASTILNSNVVVGGRNLLVNTGNYNTWDASSASATVTKADDYIKFTPQASAQWWTIEPHSAYIPIADWDVSGTYTVSVDVKFDNLKSAPAYPGVCLSAVTNNTTVGYMARVYERMFTIIPTTNDWTHFEYTVSGDYTTWTKPASGTPAYIKVYIWLYFNSNNADAVSFRRLKLEKGNKATDWTPAPEDMATADSLAGTNESLDGAIADIGELSDQLVGTVSEQNKTITDIQTYLNSLRQDLDAEIQSRQQWLNFNAAEGLVIGAAGSTFKTVTTNTSQQFRSGGTVLAETSGAEFVAPVMRSDQLLIGNWMWTRRDNGNLSLKWIG